MGQHLKARPLQQFTTHPQQQHVLEHPAGQPHQPNTAGHLTDHLGDGLRDRPVEARRQQRRWRARVQGRHQRLHHGARIDHPVGSHREWQRRAGCVAHRLGQGLEFDGGLAFIVDPVSHAQQRSDRIEQPAHARTRHTAGAALQLRTNQPQFVGDASSDRRQIRRPVDVGYPQLGQRHPPRITHGRIAARQRNRQQMSDPDEAVTVAAELENLAAPDRLVAAVTGAIERHPDDGFAEAPVLGQQRDHVRVVVLHQIQWPIARVALSPAAGVIVGMQIGGQSDWRAAYFAELTHCPLERAQCLPGGHVADVARQVGA